MKYNFIYFLLFLVLFFKTSNLQEANNNNKINKKSNEINNEINKTSSIDNNLENEGIVVPQMTETSLPPIIATLRDNSKTISIEPTYIRVFYIAPENIVPKKTTNKRVLVISSCVLGVIAFVASVIIFVHKPKHEKNKIRYNYTY
ncbi:hypothetical protein H8356DRAFT_943464 [Neocallimastix lanati (nom. inval.)]|nr:hypothetical protein H8356DRAFT_943464 [Neocallimastix sp. JGI-2020a]